MRSDAELARRARLGDRAAFSRLVELHWVRLVAMARSVVGEADAEDAVQDGLLRAWVKLPSLAEPAAFGHWVSRVVLRVCLKRVRLAWTRRVPLDRANEPRTGANPGAGIDVGRLLASLPPRQRAVMHLTVVEGLTDREIAPLLGITASSVRAHRRRARARLERQLAGGGTL